jgi:hypothetical protein
MISFAAKYPIPRTMVIADVSLALLLLPLLGTQHCQVMHGDHTHSAPPVAEAYCVFWCFTALVGPIVIPVRGLPLARTALYLQPVRLSEHLRRWVPPPRPIGFRA